LHLGLEQPNGTFESQLSVEKMIGPLGISVACRPDVVTTQARVEQMVLAWLKILGDVKIGSNLECLHGRGRLEVRQHGNSMCWWTLVAQRAANQLNTERREHSLKTWQAN